MTGGQTFRLPRETRRSPHPTRKRILRRQIFCLHRETKLCLLFAQGQNGRQNSVSFFSRTKWETEFCLRRDRILSPSHDLGRQNFCPSVQAPTNRPCTPVPKGQNSYPRKHKKYIEIIDLRNPPVVSSWTTQPGPPGVLFCALLPRRSH